MSIIRKKQVNSSSKTEQLKLFEPGDVAKEKEITHKFKNFEQRSFGKHIQRFQNCDFKDCDLKWVKLEGCRVYGGSLQGCDLMLVRVEKAEVKDCTLDTSTLLSCTASVVSAEDSVIEGSSVKYSFLGKGSVLVRDSLKQSVVCSTEISDCKFEDCAFDKVSAEKIKFNAEALAEAEKLQCNINDLIEGHND